MPGDQIVCPGCDHPAREHSLTRGCTRADCRCNWAHVHVSMPGVGR